jgi:hypothetical protein
MTLFLVVCQQLVSNGAVRATTTQQGTTRNVTSELALRAVTYGGALSWLHHAIRSHGRGHRFDTCRAHYPFPQVSGLSRSLLLVRFSCWASLGTHLDHVEGGGEMAYGRCASC